MLFDPFDPLDYFLFEETTKEKKGDGFFDEDFDDEDENEENW